MTKKLEIAIDNEQFLEKLVIAYLKYVIETIDGCFVTHPEDIKSNKKLKKALRRVINYHLHSDQHI